MTDRGVRPPPVRSVDELCSFWDTAFIERAYWSLLGREPDPNGGVHFLNQLRDGAPKLAILDGLRNSDEGRAREHGIAGLDEAIDRYRKSTRSVFGRIRSFLGVDGGDGPAARERRAISNQRAAVYAEDSTRQQDQQRWRQVSARLVGLAELADRQGQVESTLAGVETAAQQMNRRLIRIEAAIKRLEDRANRKPAAKLPAGTAGGRKPPASGA
ncbi:DUF4214 domain-containing protein [Sphingomonas sinipercae]|uniref:DUF4214 domain-containing protein n=1 Tax=Sphingomonas sinipercae TaxID=2714944 RepID=A0A6G7ZKK3_9SPHN|nr:DUF4214 domain-containing protein [Sphingomonas sinipercae]QIL01448.1 DUF4214 domain-containing protein [Sphingomonas sinipercae]